MKNIYRLLIIFSGAFAFYACSTDDLEPTLAQSKSVEGSIVDVSNLYGLLKGAMNSLSSGSYYGESYYATNEVRSDNCFSNGNSGRYLTEASFEQNRNAGFIWSSAYSVIANANIVINADLSLLTGDPKEGESYQGQAQLLRALAHFDLVKSYGQHTTPSGDLGVPVVTTFKGENLFPSRNTLTEVYTAIISDLQDAYNKIDDSYVTSNVFPSKFAAKALEARVHLYFGNYEGAEAAANVVIGSNKYSVIPATNYASSWVSNNNSIFEIDYSSTDTQGLAYIMRTNDGQGVYGDVQAVSDLLDIYDTNDVRREVIGYEGPRLRNLGKYPNFQGWDNIPIIRYEEVVLTYGEALLWNGKADEALVQLNTIALARNAEPYTIATLENFLLERRREFVFEGIRWDDMMRIGMDANSVGNTEVVIQTLSFPNNKFAYPIPQSEMDANSNMVQNASY
jgi:starch-binding outer membrane protein, SusD/RagB family